MFARVLLNLCFRPAPVRRFSIPSHATETRGSGTPRDAGIVPRHANECYHSSARGTPPRSRGGDPVSGAGRPKDGGARLSAFHRGSRWAVATSQLSSRPGFLGLGRSARSCKPAPTGGRRPCAVTRALAAPACPSPVKAPHTPAVVPERMMPGTARERVTSPRAGAALAPFQGVSSRRTSLDERDWGNVTEGETIVKEKSRRRGDGPELAQARRHAGRSIQSLSP